MQFTVDVHIKYELVTSLVPTYTCYLVEERKRKVIHCGQIPTWYCIWLKREKKKKKKQVLAMEENFLLPFKIKKK